MRHPLVFEKRHLFYLFKHVFVEPRSAGLSGAIVGDVDVHGIRSLAEVRRGPSDESHEKAVVELHAAESAGSQNSELLHVGDEAGDVRQRDAVKVCLQFSAASSGRHRLRGCFLRLRETTQSLFFLLR